MYIAPLIFLQLLLAHLLGDFYLQSNKMSFAKQGITTEGLRIGRWEQIRTLLIHSFIHALLTYILVARYTLWQIPLAIFTSHLIIDSIKSYLNKRDSVKIFLIDQLCHLLIIVSLSFLYWRVDIVNVLSFLPDESWRLLLITIIAYAIITKPTSIFLSLCLNSLLPQRPEDLGMARAGKWIGYLERILIITFIFINQFSAIGFLVTAKSIFRFGELNKANELKTTEYVLIGTLASFTIAIIVGLLSFPL